MLYLAMGSSLFQQLLSIGRLAPLQLSFGLGHPVTSGHTAVDFFVSSDLFEVVAEADARGDTTTLERRIFSKSMLAPATLSTVAPEERQGYHDGDNSSQGGKGGRGTDVGDLNPREVASPSPPPSQSYFPPSDIVIAGLGKGSGNHAVYSEQLALFDSFTGVFNQPRDPDPARVRATRDRLLLLAAQTAGAGGGTTHEKQQAGGEISSNTDYDRDEGTIGSRVGETTLRNRNASARDDVGFSRIGDDQVQIYTADNKVFEKGDEDSGGGGGSSRNKSSSGLNYRNDHTTVHLYHCLQDPKKFHPAFDKAMRGVLERDPGARLLLPEAAKVHSRRWKRSLGVEAAADTGEGGGRLVFVPEIEHPEMMEVVAACDVMLAPWGWGAGITSFEALAVGLPVVTVPSEESVLHFSRGQVGFNLYACPLGRIKI